MFAKPRQLILASIVASCASTASAHTVWLEGIGNGMTDYQVLFGGHAGKLEDYQPEKLKQIKDPYGDGPFEYQALERGFELKSKLLFEGQPVSLVAGQGKKG